MGKGAGKGRGRYKQRGEEGKKDKLVGGVQKYGWFYSVEGANTVWDL